MTDLMVEVPQVCPESGCTKSFGHELDPTDEEHGPGMYTGRCASCVHWVKNLAGIPYFIDLSPVPESDDNWGLCKLIEQPTNGEKASVVAFTMDHEYYGSELITRNNFGCVLHEEMDRDDRGQAHQEEDRASTTSTTSSSPSTPTGLERCSRGGTNPNGLTDGVQYTPSKNGRGNRPLRIQQGDSK